MNSRTKVRTVRGWDIGLAAAILAVVLLGWLTAPGSNGAAPHSGQLVGRLSCLPGPGRAGTATSAWHPGHRPCSINDPPGPPISMKGTPR
jgi:hypothetical protein